MPRVDYYRRLLETYLLRAPSHLNFWHDIPEINDRASYDRLGEYYLVYRQKADYKGPFDNHGIPLLNYRGEIGLQYNPIAIAQYGLAQFNRMNQEKNSASRFLAVADWLTQHLEQNPFGLYVWFHRFEWPYRQILYPPWPSALAQGQGISVLVRAFLLSNKVIYRETAQQAVRALELPISHGGLFAQDSKEVWLEEYVVDPPSHILNGAIAAGWGLFDYWLMTKDPEPKRIFDEVVATWLKYLKQYDTGFWSLYELPIPGSQAMMASPYYHHLHIAQLKILNRMTGHPLFEQYANQWEQYRQNGWCRNRALWHKLTFKLRHY